MSTLPRTPRVLLTALGFVTIAVSAVTCGGDSTGPTKPVITSLVRVGGDGQTGPVAQALPAKLVVKVVDQNGAPMAGVAVTWTIRSGGGTVSATSATTDASGLNSATWTLGPTPGSDTVSARLPAAASIAPVTFAATAVTGAPAALAVTGQPSSVTAGAAISPAVQVTIQDAQGNTVTAANTPLTVAITAGTGAAGATLSGTKTRSAVAGVVTFDDLRIDKAGTGYTLTATGGGLPATATAAFPVTPGAAAALAFTTQPGTTAAGAPMAVQVTARDAQGNTATGFTGAVSLSLTAGTGTAGAHLLGTTTLAATAGIASFTGLSVDSAGTGYTLTASASGPSSATSAGFTVTAGAASPVTSLVTVSSATVASSSTMTLTLRGKDANGNTVTTGGATVVFTASGGTSTGSIGATTDHADGTYTAVFTGVTAGSATTIGATIGGSTVTTTLPTVTVTTGPLSAAQSTVVASPGSVSADGGSATITVTAKDAHDNPISGATVVLAASGTGNTLTQPVGTTNASGVASGSLASTVAEGKTVSATIDAVAITQTAAVTVTAGAISAAHSIVSVSAATVPSGSTVTLTLQGRDAHDNALTTGGSTVVFSASGGTSTENIGPTADNLDGTYTAVLTGVLVGTADTVHATIGGVQVTTALPTITVTPPTPSSSLSIVTLRNDSLVSADTMTATVQVKDAAGNALPGATVVVTQSGGTGVSTVTIGTTTDRGDGSYTALLTGVVAGTATSIGATINGTAVTSTLPTLRVTPARATHMVFSVQPSNTAASATITPAVVVRAVDDAGNIDPLYDTPNGIVLEIASGTGTIGAVLTGGSVLANKGVTTFSGLSIDLAGTGYQLRAVSLTLGGYFLAPIFSTAFNIN